MREFATGVGVEADIGAPPLTQLSVMRTRPRRKESRAGDAPPAVPYPRTPRTRRRNSGTTSASNQGFFLSQPVVRQLGWGVGRNSGR